jgi:hypothetical protein
MTCVILLVPNETDDAEGANLYRYEGMVRDNDS